MLGRRILDFEAQKWGLQVKTEPECEILQNLSTLATKIPLDHYLLLVRGNLQFLQSIPPLILIQDFLLGTLQLKTAKTENLEQTNIQHSKTL